MARLPARARVHVQCRHTLLEALSLYVYLGKILEEISRWKEQSIDCLTN